MDSRMLTFLLSLLISVPLSTLYVLQMVLILKKSTIFNSSFYRIFFFCGVVDLIFYCLTVLLYVLPNLPSLSNFARQFVPIELDPSNDRWREEYRAILSVLNSLMYFLPAIQDGLNVLIAFNRFSAIVMPMQYRTLFTPLVTNLYLFLATLSGLIPSFVTIGAPGFISVILSTPEIYMLHADTKGNFPTISRSLLVSIHLLIANFIAFVLYCVTAVQLRRSKIRNANETRLLILGFVILMCNVPSIAYQAFFVFYTGNDFVLYFLILPFFNMIKTLNSPLVMVITNKMMRKSLKDLLACRRQILPVETIGNGNRRTRIKDTTSSSDQRME